MKFLDKLITSHSPLASTAAISINKKNFFLFLRVCVAVCVGRRKPRKSLERHAVLKPLTTIKSETICEHKSISGRIKARKLETIIAYDTNKWRIVIKSKTREISLTHNVQFSPHPPLAMWNKSPKSCVPSFYGRPQKCDVYFVFLGNYNKMMMFSMLLREIRKVLLS